MRLSYWEKTSFFNDIDLAVIGSGIVGLNAALHFKEANPNAKVVILEKGVIPSGASTRNAGFACFGSMTELLDDLESNSEEEVFGLVAKRWAGLQRLREKLGDRAIDYRAWGGYELFRKEQQKTHSLCLDRMAHFNKQLAPIIGNAEVFQEANNELNKFGFGHIDKLILNTAEGQIDTGKMMASLLALAQSKGIQIYNGIEINDFEASDNEVILQTAQNWEIKTNKLLICTNGFARKLLPQAQLAPARNQVLITKPIPNLKIKGTFHYNEGYVYFRNIHNRILLGGARNIAKTAETTNEFGLTQTIQNTLIDLLQNVILPSQNVEIDHWWSGIMGVGESKDPIVKLIHPNVGVGVKLGGMGVAVGSLVGEECAGLLI